MSNNERVIWFENLIDNIRSDINSMKLIEKELSYLRFKETTSDEELKNKLIELLQLASNVKVMENLCMNGLVKL